MKSKMLLKKIAGEVLVLLLIFFAVTFAQADSDGQKAKDIRKLLVVSGIYDQLIIMKNNLLDSYSMGLSASYPKIPDAFWEEYYELISQKDVDHLVDRIIPVYDKHMSHEVVRKLIVMFETPFWQEWKIKMPAISREAGEIGSLWGRELLQAESFHKNMDALIKKHDLEGLNPK
ncbi:MAG: hypothetical protein GWM98_27665 [Nitrospinaceae bacterium]|nr:DUF2059 domain-containing protein [Nitrospinaceae bacterium]NIR57543.1 DUF2059 domain-containing protein [Nitrospinaceae bacterium]NIS88013.1 DUF2059 domain-containing protein [Nitrospinaceae bacterium]NIT84877.1 DUF2059 domain-containing protein [Nitrospinaceae bacterium]NIU47053.1 DUF2059 domain-containing protein [Nitrospinaceae bacterium]